MLFLLFWGLFYPYCEIAVEAKRKQNHSTRKPHVDDDDDLRLVCVVTNHQSDPEEGNFKTVFIENISGRKRGKQFHFCYSRNRRRRRYLWLHIDRKCKQPLAFLRTEENGLHFLVVVEWYTATHIS